MVPSEDDGNLILDVQDVAGHNSRLDVFRIFLKLASNLKDETFKDIVFAYKGTPRFVLSGSDFKTIGVTYDFENPVYTIRTFAEKLKRPDGSRAFPAWEGGWLGVMAKQSEDFNEFHSQWYLNDEAASMP